MKKKLRYILTFTSQTLTTLLVATSCSTNNKIKKEPKEKNESNIKQNNSHDKTDNILIKPNINKEIEKKDEQNKANQSQNIEKQTTIPKNNQSITEPKKNTQPITEPKKNTQTKPIPNVSLLHGDDAKNQIKYDNSDLNIKTFDQNLLTPSSVSQVYADFLTNKNNDISNEQFLNNEINAKLLNSRSYDKNIEVFFNINSNNDYLDLVYTENDNNKNKTTKLTKLHDKIYKAIINFNEKNIEKISFKKILSNANETINIVNFANKNEVSVKKVNVDDSIFNQYNFSNWNVKNYEEIIQISFDISQISSQTSTDDAQFQLKYLDISNQQKQVDFKKFDNSRRGQNPTSRKFRLDLAKNELKWIEGIYFKNQSNNLGYVKLNLATSTVLDPISQTLTSTNIIFPSVNLINDIVTLNFVKDANFDLASARALVKSANPFEPWSKIIDLNIDSKLNQLSFNKNVLPNHLKNFIITDIQINNNQIFNLGLRGNIFAFETPNNIADNTISLLSFDVFKDEDNKRIYGSLKLDFDNENIEKFRNKWILLEFSINDLSEEASFIFESKYKTVIKFEDYAKFGLNGFDEGVSFNLDKAYFVSPYTLSQYSQINLNQLTQTTFRYNFDYSNVKIEQNLSSNIINHQNFKNYDNLISTRLNLTKNDLFYLVNTTVGDTILYSEQNFYAWLRYSYYATRNYNNKNIRRLKMINPVDGSEIKYQVVLGKEILANTLWNINQDHTIASIEKDLNVYQNWEHLGDQTIFSLKFGFELNKLKLEGFYNLDIKSLSKSNLSASFSYKDLKQLNIGQSFAPALDFDTKIDSLEKNEQRLKAILYNYQFEIVKLANKKIKLVIKAKKDAFLSDNPSIQYFANQKSALLNDARLLIQYPQFANQQYNVTFNSAALKNGAVSLSTKKTLLDPNNLDLGENTTSFHNYKSSGWRAEEIPARRLFSEDASAGGLKSIRQRVFSLNGDSSSSNSILGRVNAKKPNDYRFYFVTNSHVLNQFEIAKNHSLDQDITRKIKISFRIPIEFAKPQNYDTQGDANPFTSQLFWSQPFDADLEEVSNFRDQIRFWNFNKFKDNYANELNQNDPSRIFDMSIGIIDLSWFFAKYDNNSAEYNQLNQNDKKIANYILNWKNLSMIKASREAYHINDYTNLNWFLASFPVEGDFNVNKDNQYGQRYREWILAHSKPIELSGVGFENLKSYTIGFPKSIIDATGGASGSSVYDSEGNLAAIYSAADTYEYGYGFSYLFNGNKYDFYSDGTKPFNQASFYEKIRLLAYLYPQRYNGDDFSEKGFWFI
ncbi:hypothetical protein EG856_00750 [Mycoplasmopsis phocirhinis]|uniref:DUF31 domain-containing protein n=1 Tax=Mycoplasmopsis phocirhinis TaxID=142650 RepID=A0A4P6MLW2_9BACT|nr:hypothetical protein [Mycoplasmopsis phocirhinis]QBF34458.1 hypothetical protein EG856_00750 [Mycoplasmopsis phocirhinis]